MSTKNKINKVYMFHADCVKGQMFNSDEVEALEDEGWVDTPARLKLPENDDTGVSEEVAKNMNPQDLVGFVEALGFIVLTQEQLQAEANKMASAALEIQANELKLEDLTDEQITDEFNRRELSEDDQAHNEMQAMFDRFQEKPEAMSKQELKAFGNSAFELKLTMTMSEATMIESINEAVEANTEQPAKAAE